MARVVGRAQGRRLEEQPRWKGGGPGQGEALHCVPTAPKAWP